MKLSNIAKIVDGQLQGQDKDVEAMSTDSRTIKAGHLFFALKGQNFDGHDYIAQISKRGAAGAVATRVVDPSLPTIIVEDVHEALIKIARYYRQHSHAKVAAVTGSCGKTTTRALLANILSKSAPTLSSEKSYNNDIGVPLTVLRLKPEHQFAVFELGANHAGEIAKLTHIVHPHVTMITNAGPAHLEGFGGMQGIACAKGEIFQGLVEDGIAIINNDDQFCTFWKKLAGHHRIITFGIKPGADVYATELKNNNSKYQFQLHLPQASTAISLQLLGQHNVMNALAAAAAAYAIGVDIAHIKEGLESCNTEQTCNSEQKRLLIKPGINESSVIDDSYNANPLSVMAAVDVLSHQTGEKILVLGDMLELGDNSQQLHQEIGAAAAKKGIDRLFCIGEYTRFTVDAFGKKGEHFHDRDELIDALKKTLKPKTTVLIKGSRGMRMELVVNAVSNNSVSEKY